MVQAQRDARFIDEHRDRVVVFGDVVAQPLDDHELLRFEGAALNSEVDTSHASRADLTEDLVTVDSLRR
jgi:hypothetical protein